MIAIHYENRMPRGRTLRLIIIMLVLLTGLLWTSSHPVRVQAGTNSWTTICTAHDGVHVQSVGSLTWAIKQYAKLTTCAASYWNTTSRTLSVKKTLYLNWAYCDTYSYGVSAAVQWCGGYRMSPYQIDMGIDYTVTSLWPFLITTSCGSRETAYTAVTINNILHRATPYLQFGAQRTWGNC